ncbi:MAG: NAD(P)H-dependent oxidoreductase [Pseudomonadota bacterium]
MHVLTVIDHPNPQSLTHAIAVRFGDGAAEAGHTVEMADLHAEGFRPAWCMADVEADGGADLPADVRAEQVRIERCDALCLVFPLFWWGMPSMLKGWVDRVWSYGWAYDDVDDPSKSLQPARTCVMLVPSGASPQSMAPHGYPGALKTIWRTGTLGYFGMTDTRIHLLHGSQGSDERRARLLETAYQAGLTVGDPAHRQTS